MKNQAKAKQKRGAGDAYGMRRGEEEEKLEKQGGDEHRRCIASGMSGEHVWSRGKDGGEGAPSAEDSNQKVELRESREEQKPGEEGERGSPG
jgi:hypothetical protein